MNQLNYMKAHLRINSSTDITNFNDLEVIESFATLPMPKVTYPAWVEIMNMLLSVDQEEQPKPEDVAVLKRDLQPLVDAGIVTIGTPQTGE